MEFVDEQIIKARQELKPKPEIDFSRPVRVGEREYLFSEQLLFADSISILLPESFVDLPEELAKEKYPMEGRPQIIKTNGDTTINFAFNRLEHAVGPDELEEAVETFYNTLDRMHALIFYEKKVDCEEQINLGWFDYQAPTLDGDMYTMMGFVPVKDFLVHAVFSCPLQGMLDWKAVTQKVFSSIKAVRGKDGRDSQ